MDSAQPAPPFLASTLLSIAQSHVKSRPPPASAGLFAVDDLALEGGFRYGEITSIAGATGTGKTLLVFHAITSHLLATSIGEVAFVDTTGAFSPLRLQNILVSRLARRGVEARHTESVHDGVPADLVPEWEEYKSQATRLLDRVQVMRVFDFAGVVEAVGEVGRMWDMGDEEMMKRENLEIEERNRVIEDSQDEDESFDRSDGVDLDDLAEDANIQRGQVGMFVVDTIANVVSSMVLKNRDDGQALLSCFMRSLRHITGRRHICTLLINTSVGLNPSSNPSYRRKLDDNASIFMSTEGKPALGKSFAYLIDTSIFLSTIPKGRRDAEVAYGGEEEASHWEKVGIVEVLKDRYGTREGRWAAFESVSGIGIRYPL